MNKKILIIILGLLFSLLLTGCSENQVENNQIKGHVLLSNTVIEEEFAEPVQTSISTADTSNTTSYLAGSKNYLPDQIVVKFRHENETKDLLHKYDLSVREEIKGLNAKVLSGVGERDVKELADQLNSEAEVEYAELNGKLSLNSSQPNPDAADYFDHQWHYSAISLPEAWSQTTGNNAITVAVVDTGIDANHPDLEGQVIEGKNFTDSTYDTDQNGHGTHVAGTIGANNGGQVVGVNWNISLMPVKVLGDGGSGSNSSVAQGIRWAADNGADIINLSVGSPLPSQLLKEAINYAYQREVTVVVAAGNGGTDEAGDPEVLYPASYDKAIAVGAINHEFKLTEFSNYGTELDFVAPGARIYSTVPKGSYSTLSGTSMATPHVSGVAALIMAKGLVTTPDEIKKQLRLTAHDLGAQHLDHPGGSLKYGAGLINAHAALTDAKITEAVVFAGTEEEAEITLTSDRVGVTAEGFYDLGKITEDSYIYAWIDVNDNEKIDQGDYFAKTSNPVRSGVNINLNLHLIENEQFMPLTVN